VAAFRLTRRVSPSILLITLDTTRADHLGAYGSRVAQTPHIDRLAAEGVLFERAIAAAPITLPAHVSLLTALYPFRHGVRNNGNFTLRDTVPTIATALHDAGFQTAAFVSAFVLDRQYGLARGFDRYDDGVGLERRGDRTAAAVEAWLAGRAQEQRPYFIWVHLYDPHDPYDPPAPLRDRFAGRLYDGEIAFDDQVIGTLLDHLRRIEKGLPSIIAIVGDHGESLGEHGEATHGMFVYEADVRVPLILWAPGALPGGRRVTALVRGIDLAPTLLALVQAPPLTGAQGESLLPVIRGQRSGPGTAYSETYFPRFYMNWAPLRSIRDDRWKFIEAPEAELYDLTHDAQEGTNLAAADPGRTTAFRRAIANETSGSEGAITPTAVDRDTARKLAALGYVGPAAQPPPSQADLRPDPKVMIGVFNRLRAANSAIRERHFGEAESAARDVLKADRSNAFAVSVVARAEMELGRYVDAIEDFRRYAVLVPTSADAHHLMAVCLSRLGHIARALGEEDVSLGLDPRYPEAHALRGGLLASRGRYDEAVADLRTAVEIAPDNSGFRVGLARILLSAGHLDDAATEIQRALALAPDSPDAHAAAGALLLAKGEVPAAFAELRTALERRPDADDVRFDYAGALDRLGRHAEARIEYQRLAAGRETPDDIRRAARGHLNSTSSPR
jgi:choline-sulfatase